MTGPERNTRKTYFTSQNTAEKLASSQISEILITIHLPKSIGPREYGMAVWQQARKPRYCRSDEWCFFDASHPIESYPWLVRCPYLTGDILEIKTPTRDKPQTYCQIEITDISCLQTDKTWKWRLKIKPISQNDPE